MVKVKICGITCENDAKLLNKLDVDYAGFVMFYPKSKRNISIDTAKNLLLMLKPEIKKVAVTVSPTISQIKQIENLGFDIIQIHGEIEKEILDEINIPIFRAVNLESTIEKVIEHKNIIAYVYDAKIPGSGKTFDWNLLKNIDRHKKMLMLAGGLNPENVRNAVDMISPNIVDVSSGVENKDGNAKDYDKIKAFVNNAKYR